MKAIIFCLSLIFTSISFSQIAVISSLTPLVLCVGDIATLSSSNSDAGNSPILNSIWIISGPNGFLFSDTTDIGINLNFVLTENGLYTVVLINIHDDATTSQTQIIDYISARKPIANFSEIFIAVNPVIISTYGCPPVVANFTDISQSSETIVTWKWNFDEVINNAINTNSINLQNPEGIQYLYPNFYDVKLVVQDVMGCTDSITKVDVLIINGPKATFSLNQTGNNNFMEYDFNISNLSSINTISWNLGNGVIINGDFDGFTYIYPNSGVFQPIVTVTDALGCQLQYYLDQINPGISSISEKKNNLMNFFPNPFSNSATIVFKTALKNVDLVLYNVYGQKVRTISNFSGTKLKLERENLSNGIYYLHLQSENNKTETIKLIIAD